MLVQREVLKFINLEEHVIIKLCDKFKIYYFN